MPRPVLLLLCLGAFLASSACSPAPSGALNSESIRLPGGQVVEAEVAITRTDLTRGLMYRTSLAPDHGMLFVFPQSGKLSFWMYRCEIPLDIIWMDKDRRIVEISANTPPCRSAPGDCPHYGGNQNSQYVLELAGGMAARYGLKTGDQLSF